jgi:hypothetical protein
MAKRTYTYDGSSWQGLASPAVSLSNYSNLTTNQPTFRNVLINGGFGIDQRNAGTSQTITAAAALAYTVDRWYAYCTGANITGARVAGTAPSQFFYRFTGAISNTAVGFGQRIEAANSFHLAGQAVTLSVNIASTSLTSITWTAFYANTTDTFGTLASPTRTQIATGTFTVNSTLSRKTTNITIPSAATTGIEIVFTGGALLGSQTLTFDDAQLELGTVATPFEQKPIGTELSLCQRYYTRGRVYQAGYGSVATVDSGAYASISFPVTMRITPTSITEISKTLSGSPAGYSSGVTYYDVSGFGYRYHHGGGSGSGNLAFDLTWSVSVEL